MSLPFPSAHRPYPPPQGPWLMRQSWRNLLFAHWPVEAELVRRVLPAALPLDTYDGCAWLGVVPFALCGARPRYLPPLPWISNFPELNVRTYVTLDGKPGVYFFSLDAGNPIAVRIARCFAHLRYYDAKMSIRTVDGWIEYRSVRTHSQAPPARLHVRYRPAGDVLQAAPSSLSSWLTERYCMYPVSRSGDVYRGEIHHGPWYLQPAEATFIENTMLTSLGASPSNSAPLLHFARRQDMVAWGLSRIAGTHGEDSLPWRP
jgi:uncharacterized protein YqjF (DUF2071 family)